MSALALKSDIATRHGMSAKDHNRTRAQQQGPPGFRRVQSAFNVRRHYRSGRLFGLRALIRTLAVGPDEAGFWPVISDPSVTTWTPQFLTLEKVAPRPSSSSSTRKGTTLVSPTSASSPSVNPVTSLPSTSGLPAAVLT